MRNLGVVSSTSVRYSVLPRDLPESSDSLDGVGQIHAPPATACDCSDPQIRRIWCVVSVVALGMMLIAFLSRTQPASGIHTPDSERTSNLAANVAMTNASVCPLQSPCPDPPLCPMRSPCPDPPLCPLPVRCPVCPGVIPCVCPKAVLPRRSAANVTISPTLRHLLQLTEVDPVYTWFLARHPNPSKAIVVEVGAFDCKQAIEAAERGFRVLTLEPSPLNYPNCRNHIDSIPLVVKSRIDLIQVAAGSTSGTGKLNSIGGTGDHMGINTGEVMTKYHTGEALKEVPVERMDTLLQQRGMEWIYLMKIDAQGFDVFVLEGLERTLAEGRILYLIVEFWPTAIRTIHHRNASDILVILDRYDYEINDMRVLCLRGSPSAINMREDFTRPTVNAEAYANWFEDYDRRNNIKFGCWTDLIAVKRHADLDRFY